MILSTKTDAQTAIALSNSTFLNLGEHSAIRTEDIEFGFGCLNHSFTPSSNEGLTVPVKILQENE